MKVLMFGWEFPPHISGGLGTACYGLTRGLSQQDLDITFVVPHKYGDEEQGVAHIIGAEDEQYNRHHFRFQGKYGATLYDEVKNYAVVASSIASQSHFDVIHAHDWLTYQAGINAKMISGKPLVVHLHATEFDRSGRHINQRVFEVEKKGMEMADRVIAVSNFTRKIAIEKYGIAPEKVVSIHNGVDPLQTEKATLDKRLDEKIVTFLGRITLQKGPEYFVEAARKVLQKMDNVRFVMAGNGDMFPKMIRRVAELKIAHKFHFTGFLQGAEVDQMFSLSDVYVMPSVSEPFGISPLEAMRSNVPVIISKQSGVSEVLKYAIKIDFWDIDALADGIYGLLTYDSLTNLFKKNGKQEVDSLKWDAPAIKVKKLYRSLVG
jgi:glycogen synthase